MSRRNGKKKYKWQRTTGIGPRTHAPALYEIELGERHEPQSSSGIIVSAGLGLPVWLRGVVTSSLGVARLMQGRADNVQYEPQP